MLNPNRYIREVFVLGEEWEVRLENLDKDGNRGENSSSRWVCVKVKGKGEGTKCRGKKAAMDMEKMLCKGGKEGGKKKNEKRPPPENTPKNKSGGVNSNLLDMSNWVRRSVRGSNFTSAELEVEIEMETEKKKQQQKEREKQEKLDNEMEEKKQKPKPQHRKSENSEEVSEYPQRVPLNDPRRKFRNTITIPSTWEVTETSKTKYKIVSEGLTFTSKAKCIAYILDKDPGSFDKIELQAYRKKEMEREGGRGGGLGSK